MLCYFNRKDTTYVLHRGRAVMDARQPICSMTPPLLNAPTSVVSARNNAGCHLACATLSSAFDKLLAAVNVEGRTGHGGVHHKVDHERGNILGLYDTPNWQGGA